MFRPSRILAPTNMSEHSDRAIRKALDIARIYDSEVFILHVIKDPAHLCTVDYCISDELMGRYIAELRELARRGIDGQLAKFRSMGTMTITTGIRVGVSHDEILKEAEERDIDLIVISTPEATGVGRYMLGGVASHLLRGAQCKVLLAK